MASRMRWTARVGVVALAVGVAAPTAWAATWTPSPTASETTGVATRQGAWNYGSSLAKVSDSKVASIYVSDAAAWPEQNTYVRQGTVQANKSVKWASGVKQLNPSTKFSDRSSVAGSGDGNIYGTYITQHRRVINDITQPRVAFVRSYIAGQGWKKSVRLSPSTGRVDYPIVTASGDNVFVAYTNADSGAVLVRQSTDAGATFSTTRNLGTTTRNDGEGLAAWPVNCSSGSVVGVAWLQGDGTVKLSVSENSGGSYTTVNIPAVNAGDDDEGWASCDAAGTRIGVTWNESGGVYYAEYSTSTDSFTTARKNVYPFSGSGYAASYSGTVALNGAGTVGIAAPLCVQDGCDYEDNATRIDLKWLESSNSGGTFSAAEAVADAKEDLKTLNDSPSALFWDANTRYILYNGWDADYDNYRLYLSRGLS